MDMESVCREALRRQLTDVLERLDHQRDAALIHDLLQLSGAMVSYVSQQIRTMDAPEDEAREKLLDVQLSLTQAACDLYRSQREQLETRERAVAEEAQRSTDSLNRQRDALRRAVGEVQQLHRTLMQAEMEARQTARQREAMRSRATLREG